MATKEQYEFFESVYDEHWDRIKALESRAQLGIISRKDAKAQREEGIAAKRYKTDEPRMNTDLRASVGLASEAALHGCPGFTPYHLSLFTYHRTWPHPRISAFIRG
jgi:hypothetical protein